MDNQQERLDLLSKDNINYWLAGFIEGEGSVCVAIKFDKSSSRVFMQPEFNISQHYNGLPILKKIKEIFDEKGLIVKKSGSENVMVYKILGISNLIKYVIPFFRTYVLPLSCKFNEFYVFEGIVFAMKDKKHLTKDGLIKYIEIAYQTNKLGKGKFRKRTLDELIKIINFEVTE